MTKHDEPKSKEIMANYEPKQRKKERRITQKEVLTKKLNMHIDDQLNKDAPFIRDSRRQQLPSNIQLE
ncbi:hypothetical protein HanRHA438_Chr15g0704271 [Helianthus annuus]|nr:hypothetical protein HanRHA438_Chr15g0704271 [Helianthus annuus]